MYLEMSGAKAVEGAHIVVNNYHGGKTQQWQFLPNGVIQNMADTSLVIDCKGTSFYRYKYYIKFLLNQCSSLLLTPM